MKKLRSTGSNLFLIAIFFGLLVTASPVLATTDTAQKQTAEQDYDRGYEDGYQAYEAGFYGMPKDTEESKAYEDGFADGQQQAEDDKIDRKRVRRGRGREGVLGEDKDR